MQPEAPQPKKVPDLMAALEASLAAVKGEATATARPTKKKPATRKPAARRRSQAKPCSGRVAVELEPDARLGAALDAPAVRQLAHEVEAPARRARRVGLRLGDLEARARGRRPRSAAPGRRSRRRAGSRRRRPGPAWRIAFVTSSETSSRASSSRRGERWSDTSPSARRASAAESGSRASSTSYLTGPSATSRGIVHEVEPLAHARDVEHSHHLLPRPGTSANRRPRSCARCERPPRSTRSPLESMKSSAAQVEHDGARPSSRRVELLLEHGRAGEVELAPSAITAAGRRRRGLERSGGTHAEA